MKKGKLIFRMHKDKGIFHHCSLAEHKGDIDLSKEIQSEAMKFTIEKMNEIAYKLKDMGYNHETIKFSIETK